jgi:hypothetical protein
VCTERTDPKDIIIMDCNHPACVSCYKKHYSLPKGGKLSGGIILKCFGCESTIGQVHMSRILDRDSLMFYLIESAKYAHLTSNELKLLIICVCSQCKVSYTAIKSCGDEKYIPTRCESCIGKDTNIPIVSCSNESCGIPLSRCDGCNVLKCRCLTYTCFNCGERLGCESGHDRIHFRETREFIGSDIYFRNECCQGRGVTSEKPTSSIDPKIGLALIREPVYDLMPELKREIKQVLTRKQQEKLEH